MAFGTVFTLDSVAQLQTTVEDIGEDALWANLDAFFAAHNELFRQAAELLAETTTDRQRQFGDVDQVEAQELDEFGMPSAQKIAPAALNLGFPLRRYGSALQWTRWAFENMTGEEFAKQVNAILDADERNLYAAFRRGLFRPTNYNFVDRQVTPTLTLSVRPLLNADGDPIPAGPSGQTFDGSTHTHYHGVTTGGTVTAAQVIALLDTVREHFTTGRLMLYIAKAQETAVRGLTGFTEILDVRLRDQRTQVVAATGALDPLNHFDRLIGLFDGAEVWVKPWIPDNYMFAFLAGQPMPLVRRVPRVAGQVGLRLVGDFDRHPLRAREWEHRFGIGGYNRMNGAVLDVATGSGNYTEPTL